MPPRARRAPILGFYESMASMLDAGLTLSAVKLAEMAFGLKEAGHECFTEAQLSHAYLLTGDHYYVEGEYQLADHYYDKLIQYREGWAIGGLPEKPFDGSSETESQFSLEIGREASLADLKYKRANALLELGRSDEALKLLATVPRPERNARVYMLLGTLHRLHGSELTAMECFRKVLMEVDGAIDAAEQLAAMGMRASDINVLLKPRGWIPEWIQGQVCLINGDGARAVHIMQDSTVFSDLPHGFAMLGKARHCLGDHHVAAECFEKARDRMSTMLYGMDALAQIYATKLKDKVNACENLTTEMRNLSPKSAIAYLCMAHLATVTRKPSVSLAMAEKAAKSSPLMREAYLLLADLCLTEDVDRSVRILKDAIHIDRYCFEAYEILFDINVRLKCMKDATTVCNLAYDVFGGSERVLTMEARRLQIIAIDANRRGGIEYADSYERFLGTRMTLQSDFEAPRPVLEKCRMYLEKALKKNRRYLPAVCELADVYNGLGMNDEAIALLSEMSKYIRTGRVHRLHGLFLFTYKDEREAAFDAYTCALDLDPQDGDAINGMADMTTAEDIADARATPPEAFQRPGQPFRRVSFIARPERMDESSPFTVGEGEGEDDENDDETLDDEDDDDEDEDDVADDEDDDDDEEFVEPEEEGEILEDVPDIDTQAIVAQWMEVDPNT